VHGLARCAGKIARAGEALGRILRQRTGDHGVEARGRAGHARGRIVEVGLDRRDLAVAVERHRARQRVVEDAAERVDVGARVDRLAADLLRRDVVERADEHPDLGQRGVRGGALREPEVGQVDVLDAALGRDQDVAGLDVAVHEPATVRGVERGGDLTGDLDRTRRLEPLARDQRAEVGPRHEAHRDVQQAVGLAGLVDRDDVRVVDQRGEPRLAREALAERGIGPVLGRDQLECHRAPERHLRREVDGAHPALARDALDSVPGELDARLDGVRSGPHASKTPRRVTLFLGAPLKTLNRRPRL
jgi:hypothetical protein